MSLISIRQNISKAAIQAIQAGKSDFYTAALGIVELRKAIAKTTNAQYHTDYTFENVAVTVGENSLYMRSAKRSLIQAMKS